MPIGCVIHWCISEDILLRKLLHFTGICLYFVYFTKTSPTAERVMLNELGIPEKKHKV